MPLPMTKGCHPTGVAICSYTKNVAKVKTPQRKTRVAIPGEEPPISLPPSEDINRKREVYPAHVLEQKKIGPVLTDLGNFTILHNENLFVRLNYPMPLMNAWIASHLPVEQIEEVTQLANVVFGDYTVATSWLREPNLATDNQSPISLLGTPNGFERVKNLLLRIQYGVLA